MLGNKFKRLQPMFYKVYCDYSYNQYIWYSLFNQIWFIAIIYL